MLGLVYRLKQQLGSQSGIFYFSVNYNYLKLADVPGAARVDLQTAGHILFCFVNSFQKCDFQVLEIQPPPSPRG